MSALKERVPVDRGNDDAPIMVHIYRTRRGRKPQPGDKAVCGHVKKTPPRDRVYPMGSMPGQRCVVCDHMEGLR